MKGRPVKSSTGNRISPAPPMNRLAKKQAAKVTSTNPRLM